MSFSPDSNKQATEALYSRKVNSDDQTKLTFNGSQVDQCSSQKHLGLFLDNKLDFNQLLDEKINKCNKITRMIKKLSTSVSRQSLLNIYKSFVRSILDYGTSFMANHIKVLIILYRKNKTGAIRCLLSNYWCF